jgi:succinate dehydrogenase / fumarate reductase flavoprotein subunit
VDPDAIDLKQIDYEPDVLVIGGGGAASAAALTAQEQGSKVLIATKLRIGDANTMMAEGGIQVADKPQDSPARHYLDAMGGGHFFNDPELLEVLTIDAPKALQWLESLGVMFDKEDDGSMKVLHGGGTSWRRMHSAGDMTGAAIMRVLRDEVRNRPHGACTTWRQVAILW